MADRTVYGTGDLTFDKSRMGWPNEINVFLALILLIGIFEILGQLLPYMNNQSLLFDFNTKRDGTILNMARIKIIILQVSIVGIIALGSTQVIISGGIDLSPGSIVGASVMIAMSFAQTELVNGNPNPKAIFGPWAMDLPVIVPILVALACGVAAGATNGFLIAYTRIPPFIATLGMMVTARGISKWWSKGAPVSFPTENFGLIGNGLGGWMPVVIFVSLAILFHVILRYTVYGKHTYAIGSNEEAARMSGISVNRQKLMIYAIAGMLAGVSALVLSSKNLTAQAGMGLMYELDAIAMTVIGGVSLSGGRGSIVGTVLGALIFGVIISGFTYLRLDAFYQEMVKGVIIVSAVILDQWRQRRAAART